ncbi:MAG: L-Ala-D/L-Glu epimerase [Inquilinus sp.]|nr:L-Ala-D/L-Glu epimerase [Inquilinus sp.]
MPRRLTVREEVWPLAGTFAISRGSRTEARVLTVEIGDGGARGRGECTPYARYGETIDAVKAAIEGLGPAIAGGMDRAALQAALPAGAARNAVDCALWDLEAKRSGRPVWQLAGLDQPGPVTTVYTISLDTPEEMAASARAEAWRPLLKLKLTGAGDLERVRAIRAAAPDSQLVVDANEAWRVGELEELALTLARLGVEMIEQPLPAGEDDALFGQNWPVPLCADESCHTAESLPALAGKYAMVNIKLDKTGGLTEALKLRAAALKAGFGVMVGCMLGSSLAMAPAFLVAQGARLVDLDAPLWLREDRDPGLSIHGSVIEPPPAALWG